MKKEKEKIRNQIIKSIDAYRGKEGFYFFDVNNFNVNVEEYALDSNDIEVLLMKLDKSTWLLLTTKCLYVKQDRVLERIDGIDIESFQFMNSAKRFSKEKRSEFERPGDFKRWLYSGPFKIIKKDDSSLMINLPNHEYGFCLLYALKKLLFVSRKYEGV